MEMILCGVIVRVITSAIENVCSSVFINLLLGFTFFIAMIYGKNFKSLKALLVTMRK